MSNISHFINQDEEDSDIDVEEVVGEEDEEEVEVEAETEEDEEKIDRNWSVLKTTPQLRKSKVLQMINFLVTFSLCWCVICFLCTVFF